MSRCRVESGGWEMILELAIALASPHVTGPKFFLFAVAAVVVANALFPMFRITRSEDV